MRREHHWDRVADIEDLARLAWGAPNQSRSSRAELRFGSKGSKSVDLINGVWFDHEDDVGGGYVDLYRMVHGRDPGRVPATNGGTSGDTDKPTDAERTAWAQRIWDEAQCASDSRVERYLQERCLTLPVPKAIRYTPRLWHKNKAGWWPGMVAAVRDLDGRLIAVHRTWLSNWKPEKAPIDPNKMSLGPTRGCAVHLAPAGRSLILGEEVETVLSAMQESGLPGWAALGDANLQNVRLPSVVREVIVLQDNDPAGEREAEYAAWRFKQKGFSARIARPPDGYNDFNDVLMGRRS